MISPDYFHSYDFARLLPPNSVVQITFRFIERSTNSCIKRSLEGSKSVLTDPPIDLLDRLCEGFQVSNLNPQHVVEGKSCALFFVRDDSDFRVDRSCVLRQSLQVRCNADCIGRKVPARSRVILFRFLCWTNRRHRSQMNWCWQGVITYITL